ncbi:MAG: ABC transporter ATP-binding protein [Acidobacteriota bacterium]
MIEDGEEQALGKIYDTRLIARLWPYVRPHSAWIALSFVLIPLRALLEVTPPLIVGAAINYLAHGEVLSEIALLEPLLSPQFGLSVLTWLFVVALTVAIVNLGLEWLRTFSMMILGQRTVRDVREVLFDHVQRLPMRFFDRYPIGRLVTRLTNDMENLAEMFASGVVALIADLFIMVFFGYLLFTIEPRLAFAAMVVVPFLALAAFVFRYKVREAFREVRVKIARINTHLQETISGIRVVQLFSRERLNAERFRAENASHRDSWFRSIHYDALLFSSVDLATNLTRAIIFFLGARLLGADEVTLGTVYVFTDYMVRFFRPMMDLSAKYSVMQSSMASAERTFQLLDELAEPPDGAREAVERISDERGSEVVFDRVSFSYGSDPVLKDVSFRVAPGERVALVGHTGSGKTTTLKMLARLYEIGEGSIRVDGVDVRDWKRSHLRRRMAFVLQDVFLFEGSVRENLALGRRDVGEQELAESLTAANAKTIVDRLPGGLDEIVRERGSNFSSGERQLLSFARALAGDPDLLLLDEATSSVDSETEALIQEALRNMLEGKTSIVVAHRLSTIQDCDRIFVFHQGQIVEEGSHEDLLAQGGTYARLHRLQYSSLPESAA